MIIKEKRIFIVNTNRTHMPNAYIEMVTEKKGAAYYFRKTKIQKIKTGNTVCLYHVGVGVIGIGVAKTDYQKKDHSSGKDEEYYVPIEFEYLVDIKDCKWKTKAVHAREINCNFNSSHRFRHPVFQLPSEFGDYIKTTLANKGNKRLK